MSSFSVGTRVEGKGGVNKGIVAFCGPTQFAEGIWVGIVLDEANGKNNGCVKGVQYFECPENHGIFMKPSQVFLEGQGGGGEAQKSKMPVPSASGIKPPATIRKDASTGSKSKLESSPGQSPKMSPAQSMEKLRPSGITPPKKSPKEENKAPSTQSRLSASGGQQSRAGPAADTRLSRLVKPVITVVGPRESPKKHESEARTGAAPADSSQDAVKSLVRKIEEVPSSIPSMPLDRKDATELEYLRAENKDLSEKLDSLRAKRKEDHAKLVELERTRIHLQQLQEYKAKMGVEHADLHRQLMEARKEAKDAIEARHAYQDEMSGVAEQLEMAALDREMAEEKAELATQELDAMKVRVEELELDLELLRNEMEQAGKGGGVGAPVGNSVQMKQLEQQNERLREALVKMRDVTGQANSDRASVAKENEELRLQIADVQRKHEKMRETVQAAETQLAEYKEQVDAALGSEQMIETLTERNLDMEEKLRMLEETIEDLEAMRQMDEEILETERDATKELRQELDLTNGRVNELNVQIKTYILQADDYEKTIVKFRQRVCDLQEEIQDHKDQILRLEARFHERDNDTTSGDAGDGARGASASTTARNFAEMIESEMRRVELDFAKQHAQYLKAFLPDNFCKPAGDNDAVLVSVLFPRLTAKTQQLIKFLDDKYPPVPGGIRREHVMRSHKAEQWAYAAKFVYHLQTLAGVLRKFDSAIARCSVDRLARLAQLHPEMAMQERAIDQYIELLRTNRMDENTAVDSLAKAINYFQVGGARQLEAESHAVTNVFSVHMAGDAFDTNLAMSDTMTQNLAGLRWMRVNCQRINFFLQAHGESSEIARLSDEMKAIVGECEQHAMRARNRIPTERDLLLNNDFQIVDEIASTVGALEKVAHILHHMCTVASTQVSMSPDVDGLEVSRLKEMMHGAVEKVHGNIDIEKAADQIRVYVNMLRGGLVRLSDVLDLGNLEVERRTEKKTFPPLLERAHARKQDAVEAEGLRWQLEKKENEIADVKKAMRASKDELSNLRLRLEMADKRIETSGKADDAKVQRLQARVDELIAENEKKQREFDQTMDALQHDLLASEKENSELKERAKQMSKKALLANITQAAIAPGSPTTPGGASPSLGTADYYDYVIGDLQSQLRWSNAQLRALRTREMRANMAHLPPLPVPSRFVAGPASLASPSQSARNDEVDKLIKEFYQFKAEYRRFTLPHLTAKAQSREQREAAEEKRLAQLRQLNHWFNDASQSAAGAAVVAESGLVFPNAAFTRTLIHAQSGGETQKRSEKLSGGKVTSAGGGGIHSDEYKAMRAKLAKYAEESKAFLAAHGTTGSRNA